MTDTESADATLWHGDCRDVLPEFDAESIDAVVTDPPYGLRFMGSAWDHAVPGPEYFAALLRVTRSGGHLFAFGAPKLHHRLMAAIEDAGWVVRDAVCWLHGQGFPKRAGLLKPAWEPIVVACKGRGGELFTESARVPIEGGRWPANVALDEAAAEALDAQVGTLTSGVMRAGTQRAPSGSSPALGAFGGNKTQRDTYGDSGGPSRFYYTSKARRDKGNTHPTVKPVDLMAWIVRLAVGPSSGALVLDPFMGSGTTGVAALREGARFVGIEREADYFRIASRRLAKVADEDPLFPRSCTERSSLEAPPRPAPNGGAS